MTKAVFSDKQFWNKLTRFATKAGREVVEKALTLYFAAQRPETPLWAKTVIYSALAYFVLPMDAIPDVTPIAGFADDLGTLAAALATVAMAITPEIKETAHQKVVDWFGEELPEEEEPMPTDDPIRVITID
ncbi:MULTISPECIES: DUF1232 domain-containing protein [unclassified Leptolyngbya]|uniref:YkvA family protein n=1 Tax=unclassified Leptolyngbya TaxID=2650499 RepID=UPI001685A5F1|nr:MULTISPECIES: DUF1232 domain-containing protein [unclassified Leptolyngbya]MBD1911934.1 DUF1232 domain-containing protein [Leptolyngbya sp. FACHB-8]MBD2154234.1 DUF1232 domain-containing protein [Leptolyngbya sp. FACHB-16]